MRTTTTVLLFLGFWVVASPLIAQDVPKGNLASEARAILKQACHRCHGEEGAIEGGFSYVLDRGQLVARKQVVPGSAAQSKMMRRILNDEMPPDGESPRLTREQIEVLTGWVDLGAPDFNPARSARAFVAPPEMAKSMLSDLMSLQKSDRKFARYLTLTHLYNAGRSEEELQSFQLGITKLVNSLSWGRKVVAPRPIGTPPTLLRIDLRHYKWSANIWNRIASADPYGLRLENLADAEALSSESECDLPWVRGDWFVAAAARPPLYHEILQLPATARELETLLRVDADDNIRSTQAARAGFNGSAVSRNNRLIERHESSYGYYWKSYDFGNNVDRKNLFSHPLGPGDSERDFEHDGGELIFSLPNGFQGYMLVDAKGGRIDKGPTEIVSDPKRPDRAVENGLSCMSCHVRGLLPKADQIRLHVAANPGAFKIKELDTVLALYTPQDQFQKLLEMDAETFRGALGQAGLPVSISEPIVALAILFESELDLTLVAAEAGLSPDEFQQRLKKSPKLARILGSLLTPGGTVKRDSFAQVFAEVAVSFGLGTPTRQGAIELTETNRKPPSVAPLAASAVKPPSVSRLESDAERRSFKSRIVELTDRAPADWILTEAKIGALIMQGRDYAFTDLPDELLGGTIILRSGLAGWLDSAALRAKKPCTAYALLRTREHGKVHLGEVTLTKFVREGWEEVDGDVKTNVDEGFDSRWIALRKNVAEGAVVLQLDTIDFGRIGAVFAFQGRAPTTNAIPDGNTPEKGTRRPVPKSGFLSPVLEFTDKASPNWIFKEAKIGSQVWSDAEYLLTALPDEMVGGTLVLRDRGNEKDWLANGSVTALKDCTAYALVRWKYLGKEEVGEGVFANFKRDGWEEVDGTMNVSFPNGEDWKWRVVKRPVSKGDVSLDLKAVKQSPGTVLFVFK